MTGYRCDSIEHMTGYRCDSIEHISDHSNKYIHKSSAVKWFIAESVTYIAAHTNLWNVLESCKSKISKADVECGSKRLTEVRQ